MPDIKYGAQKLLIKQHASDFLFKLFCSTHTILGEMLLFIFSIVNISKEQLDDECGICVEGVAGHPVCQDVASSASISGQIEGGCNRCTQVANNQTLGLRSFYHSSNKTFINPLSLKILVQKVLMEYLCYFRQWKQNKQPWLYLSQQ